MAATLPDPPDIGPAAETIAACPVRPGVGKSAFVQQIALRLLCESPRNAVEPCGQCSGCTLFRAGNHPDYHYVTFAVDEKTGKVSTGRPDP